jgi:hypothetical protein
MRRLLTAIKSDTALVQQLASGDYLRAGSIEPLQTELKPEVKRMKHSL